MWRYVLGQWLLEWRGKRKLNIYIANDVVYWTVGNDGGEVKNLGWLQVSGLDDQINGNILKWDRKYRNTWGMGNLHLEDEGN